MQKQQEIAKKNKHRLQALRNQPRLAPVFLQDESDAFCSLHGCETNHDAEALGGGEIDASSMMLISQLLNSAARLRRAGEVHKARHLDFKVIEIPLISGAIIKIGKHNPFYIFIMGLFTLGADYFATHMTGGRASRRRKSRHVQIASIPRKWQSSGAG